jgi:trehalose-6-phosphatase
MLERKVSACKLVTTQRNDLLSVRASLSGTSGSFVPSRLYAVSVHTRNVESQYNRGLVVCEDSSNGVNP